MAGGVGQCPEMVLRVTLDVQRSVGGDFGVVVNDGADDLRAGWVDVQGDVAVAEDGTAIGLQGGCRGVWRVVGCIVCVCTSGSGGEGGGFL